MSRIGIAMDRRNARVSPASYRREIERLFRRGHVNRIVAYAASTGREDAALDRLQAELSDQGPGSDEFSADEFLSCDSNGGA